MLVHEMQLFINIIIENRVWEFSRQPRNPLAMAMVTRCSKKKKKRAKKGRGLGKRCSYASKYNKQGGNDVRKTRADMKEGANMVCKTVLETLLKKKQPNYSIKIEIL